MSHEKVCDNWGVPSLEAVLDARERRVARKQRLVETYNANVIAFTMNIPGPVKNTPCISACFFSGIEALLIYMKEHDLTEVEEYLLSTGPEGYFIFPVTASQWAVKRKLVTFEEDHPIGRWFDFDIMDSTQRAITREEIGAQPRRCFLCHDSARNCGRNRSHSVEELVAYTEETLNNYLQMEGKGVFNETSRDFSAGSK